MAESAPQIYTFVFTDLEGSTAMWEKFPSHMDAALERHDGALRECFARHSGHVFKTVGDMFCVAFENPDDACAAVLDAQTWLHTTEFPELGNLRARAAIYTGRARMRDDDYFGTALNRVSRLLNAGHGAQILVSSPTRDAMSLPLASPLELIDLGPHRLRDVEGAETIFQLWKPDLRRDFPPLRTIDAIPNNLPRELSTFVGRERELQDIKTLIREKNLITLVGAGGSGKTRLALQAATELLHKFAGGVWLVDLAPLNDAGLVDRTILATLGLPEEAGVPPAESLKKHLKTSTSLIVLDNCEHVIESAARISEAIVRNAPNTKIVATSREALGVAGEYPWRVPSLSLPTGSIDGPADLMERSEAARLFVERATATQPSFVVDDGNFGSIVAICTRLDGIPLALELAAARVKVLPVDQIAARLDDRFRLLTGGSRTALPRQQTLRALIDWSYNLLSDSEKMLLARLAVFAGGWTLEACEQICGGEPLEPWEVLDFLSQLVDKSLVTFDEVAGRYRLLETVRQYAREKLFELPEAIAIRTQHLDHFTQVAKSTEAHLSGPDQVQYLNALEADHDNMRAALEWSLSMPESASTCLQLAKSLGRFWETRGFFTQGREWLEKAIVVAPDELEDLRMRALNQLGNICREQGDYDAAEKAFNDSLELAKRLDFQTGIAVLYNNLGIVCLNQKRFEEAKNHYEASIEICRAIKDERNLAAATDNLAQVYGYLERFDDGRQLHDDAMAIFKRREDTRGLAISLFGQADLELRAGNLDLAGKRYRESLELMSSVDMKVGLAGVLEGIAAVATERGDGETGAKLLGFTARMRERLGLALPPQSVDDYEKAVRRARELLGDEQWDIESARGRQLSREQILAIAFEKA